jgi:MFS family permease
LLVSRPNGIEIFVLQALYRTSVAGVFGAVFTFVIQQVPVSRMAEAVGMIGTASFVGMLIGPLIGDVISSGGAGGLATRTELDLLFLVAAGLGSASVVAAWFATSREVRPPPRRHVPIAPLLRRYRPGVLLAIGVVTGIALGMPATFLRTFAAELSINRLAPYFTVYAVTAIAARLATRRLTERLGIRGAILIGMSLLVVGVVSYLAVATESQLLLPALFTGAGQAILYPAVVAGGSAAFPARYRGVGTTLMLATIDLGTLSGAPLIGGIVHFGRMIGLPGYPMMFVCIAALLIVSTVFYAGTGRSADAGRAESEKSPNPAVVLKGAPVEATSSA